MRPIRPLFDGNVQTAKTSSDVRVQPNDLVRALEDAEPADPGRSTRRKDADSAKLDRKRRLRNVSAHDVGNRLSALGRHLADEDQCQVKMLCSNEAQGSRSIR